MPRIHRITINHLENGFGIGKESQIRRGLVQNSKLADLPLVECRPRWLRLSVRKDAKRIEEEPPQVEDADSKVFESFCRVKFYYSFLLLVATMLLVVTPFVTSSDALAPSSFLL